MELNSCHFRFFVGFASYGLSWELVSYMRRRSALYVGPSPLERSMPIVQIASKALHDANDALLAVHRISRITRPHFDCFSGPRFGALSPPP